jgi:tRNA/rRNA methyltransferase
MPDKSPPAAKQQLDAFFSDLERELERVEFFRPEEKRGTMSVNLRNIFQRMAPTQQDIRTLHGVINAIAQGRKGPARGGVLEPAEAQKLRDLLAEHGGGRVPGERGPVRGLARLLRRNPTEAERVLWQALVNDRRFAGRAFKRQVPIGPHIVDFVSFPLRCVIELVPAQESVEAVETRAQRRAYLGERDYRVCEVRADEVERDVTKVLDDLFAAVSRAR